MCMLLSLARAPPSGSGNTKRTVCGSTISRRDPGLKFIICPCMCGCRSRKFSSQLSLTISASKLSKSRDKYSTNTAIIFKLNDDFEQSCGALFAVRTFTHALSSSNRYYG